MSLGLNSLKVTLLGLTGLASGFLVDAVLTAFFGLGAKTDILFVASVVPLGFQTIITLQCQKVFQPIFLHKWNTIGQSEAWNLLNKAVIYGVGWGILFCGLGIALSPLLVELQISEYSGSDKQQATFLAQAYFVSVIGIIPIQIYNSVLTGLGHFLVPSISRTIENLFKLVLAFLVLPRWGLVSIPIAIVLSSIWQAQQSQMALKRLGYRFVAKPEGPGIGFGSLLRTSSFPLMGHGLSLAVELIQNLIATSLGVGALSALRFATRIIDSVAGLVTNGVVTASGPPILNAISVHDFAKAERSLSQGIQYLILIGLPACGALIALGDWGIRILFERKNFTPEHTALIWKVAATMSPYILFSRLYSLLEIPFYGRRDTRTPVIGQLFLAILYTLTCVGLSRAWGLVGFSVAKSTAYILGCGCLYVLLRRGPFPVVPTLNLRVLIKVIAASALFTTSAYIVGAMAGAIPKQQTMRWIAVLLGGGLVSSAILAIMVHLLGLVNLIKFLRRFLPKRVSAPSDRPLPQSQG